MFTILFLAFSALMCFTGSTNEESAYDSLKNRFPGIRNCLSIEYRALVPEEMNTSWYRLRMACGFLEAMSVYDSIGDLKTTMSAFRFAHNSLSGWFTCPSRLHATPHDTQTLVDHETLADLVCNGGSIEVLQVETRGVHYTNRLLDVVRHGSVLHRRHQTTRTENLDVMRLTHPYGSDGTQLLHDLRCGEQRVGIESIRLHQFQKRIGRYQGDTGSFDISLLQRIRYNRDVMRTLDTIRELEITLLPHTPPSTPH